MAQSVHSETGIFEGEGQPVSLFSSLPQHCPFRLPHAGFVLTHGVMALLRSVMALSRVAARRQAGHEDRRRLLFIRSERLFLRPGWPEDRDEVLRTFASPEQAEAVMAGCAAGRGRGHYLVTLPTLEGPAPVIGAIAVDGRQCWIAPAFREQGYASEATRAVQQTARALGFDLDPEDGGGMRKAA